MKHIRIASFAALALVVTVAAASAGSKKPGKGGGFRPIPPTAVQQDSLIRPGESHFEHLWQITFGGQNAEAYWSADGRKISFQAMTGDMKCDQQYWIDLATGKVTLYSTGKGRTTCGYWMDNDQRLLFASTHLGGDACPPEADMSQGYVWPIYPSYDIFTCKPDGSDIRRLTDNAEYDAEATVSVDQKWIIFTSKRDGDIDLYKIRPDGTGLARLTNSPGYDGGAYFSHSGNEIVWRTYRTDDATKVAAYRDLLAKDLVKPAKMDIWVAKADGTNQRRITDKPGASFAPFFTPDDKQIIYSSNYENPRSRNFDLYLVPVAGGEPVPVTRDSDFDGFPMFSPDGQWLVFCSNRGGKVAGETNMYIAKWKP